MVIQPYRTHEGCFYSDHLHASPWYTMYYNPISTVELKKFIRDRTGKEAPDRLTRYRCISRLEDLDRDWTFRFMDLPPEMRNLIYEQLLPRDKGRKELLSRRQRQSRRSHLDILRVSKLVHKEAVGILNAVNTAYPSVSIYRYKPFSPDDLTIRVRLGFNGAYHTVGPITKELDANGMFATQIKGLHHMRKIELHVSIGNDADGIIRGVPHTIMSAFVESARNLRSLLIVLPYWSEPSSENVSEWFSSFAKLSEEVKVDIHHPDLDMKKELSRQINKIRSST